MKKLFKKTYIGIFALVLLLFVSGTAALEASADRQVLENQLMLLEEFLGDASGGNMLARRSFDSFYDAEAFQELMWASVDSRVRDGFVDIFTGGIWDTPLTNVNIAGFENHFAIGITNEDDVLNQELKEAINLATGIPAEQMVFVFVHPIESAFSERAVRTIFEWIEYDPDEAYIMLNNVPMSSYAEMYSEEQIALLEDFLRGRRVQRFLALPTPHDFIPYGPAPALPNNLDASISPASISHVFMGARIDLRNPRTGAQGGFTVGHPRNHNRTEFFTAAHSTNTGAFGEGTHVYQNGVHIGDVAHSLFTPLVGVDWTRITLRNGITVSTLLPDGTAMANFRSNRPSGGSAVRAFGATTTGTFHGAVTAYTAPTINDGFRLSEFVMVFGNGTRVLQQGDSGAALAQGTTAVGVLSFRTITNVGGVGTPLNGFTGSWRYN
ncbi:MAG: S1 family peptidase [Defluviitaleaceae bacterium]|nr:S1 family peptidase [Defluviitaleaceae bacterium]